MHDFLVQFFLRQREQDRLSFHGVFSHIVHSTVEKTVGFPFKLLPAFPALPQIFRMTAEAVISSTLQISGDFPPTENTGNLLFLIPDDRRVSRHLLCLYSIAWESRMEIWSHDGLRGSERDVGSWQPGMDFARTTARAAGQI